MTPQNESATSSVGVKVVDYGIGNLRSAQKAFEFIGSDVELTSDHASIASADALVLPGVGSFGPTMEALRRLGLDDSIRSFINSGRPFLGICVGMQVLYESSEESPGVDGLGLIPGVVTELTGPVRTPQMQWNTVQLRGERPDTVFDDLGAEPWLYFVHSYAAQVGEYTIASCEYGQKFSAAIRRENIVATQFHPEKSSRAGLRLLANFVASASR